MTHKERVLASLERKNTDRTPLWSGSPKPETRENLLKFYKLDNWGELLNLIGDDFRWNQGWRWKHPEEKPVFDYYGGIERKRSHAADFIL